MFEGVGKVDKLGNWAPCGLIGRASRRARDASDDVQVISYNCARFAKRFHD